MLLSSKKHVVCAISGGVDSAVTAYMLLKEGYRVSGIFMKNWDTQNESLEASTNTCSLIKDKEDARYVCEKLNIPFFYVDFSKFYWNRVFSEFLNEYENGLTPNPDILCNKYIKFPMLLEYCKKNMDSVDYLATGHYAQVKFNNETQKYHLYKSQDHLKDQTFFLCQLDQNTLKQTLFPIGKYEKSYVRKIASEIGLDRVSSKKGSVGICFIGKRKFSDFIDQYLPRKYGEIVDVESGKVIGAHRGIHHFTIGQRLNCIQIGQKPYFVTKKDVENKKVYAACGTDHPALYCDEFYVNKPHWISQNYENESNEFILQSNIDFKFQQKHYESPILFMKKIQIENGEVKYLVKSKYALRGLAPGQFSVFYSKNECIGSAKILATSKSLYDLNYQGPIVNTDKLLTKRYVETK